MENLKFVEVTEAFEMVKPGQVYPSVIEVGEQVQGRIADVALELGKGVLHDPEADAAEAEKARKEAEAAKAAEAKVAAAIEQRSLLQEAAAVPDSKVSPTGETKPDAPDGEAKK